MSEEKKELSLDSFKNIRNEIDEFVDECCVYILKMVHICNLSNGDDDVMSLTFHGVDWLIEDTCTHVNSSYYVFKHADKEFLIKKITKKISEIITHNGKVSYKVDKDEDGDMGEEGIILSVTMNKKYSDNFFKKSEIPMIDDRFEIMDL